MDDYTPEIHGNNIQPGMVIQFAGTVTAEDAQAPVFAAEVTGRAGNGLWLIPEDAPHAEVFAQIDPNRVYAIIG